MASKKYQQFKRELLKDKEIKKAYETIEPEFKVIEMVIQKRIERGLSQEELAKKVGTKQSSISRFESGGYNPTLGFLKKISKALDTKLEIVLKE